MEQPPVHVVAFAMVTEIQAEYIKTPVVQHAPGSNDIVRPAAALPAMKKNDKTLAAVRLRRVMTEQAYAIPAVKYPILLRVQ